MYMEEIAKEESVMNKRLSSKEPAVKQLRIDVDGSPVMTNPTA